MLTTIAIIVIAAIVGAVFGFSAGTESGYKNGFGAAKAVFNPTKVTAAPAKVAVKARKGVVVTAKRSSLVGSKTKKAKKTTKKTTKKGTKNK